ncbi:hypothetical protein CKO50_20375 [Pseudoalteromonas sp. HM-SA03]|uniref:hypothetical protein n=1 Tax=Pseudoalteromonas sp. HM-SA03 TaxID=2029678 RepID=UPI000BADDC66|nr:hypothetical protein [Pseudoalteromonas sp. HM-SA03]PAX99570.1 hypothetical protein CKO50_20375 [Pseudoalteromonas sp. HM-SA03]
MKIDEKSKELFIDDFNIAVERKDKKTLKQAIMNHFIDKFGRKRIAYKDLIKIIELFSELTGTFVDYDEYSQLWSIIKNKSESIKMKR